MNTFRYTYSDEAIAFSQYRADWKCNYKEISSAIRKYRAEARALYAADKPLRAAAALCERESLRGQAREAMEELAEKKAAWKALLADGHIARTANVLQAAE